MSTNTNTTPCERLAMKMAPAYKALGIVASTEAGKTLFALAFDSDRTLDWNRRESAKYDGKRPSKSSQSAKYYEGMSWGERKAYVTALATMCAGASNGEASVSLCRRVINIEIDAMMQRTDAQKQAAPITNLFSKAIDF